MKGNDDRNPKFCRLCWFELGTLDYVSLLLYKPLLNLVEFIIKSWTCKDMASFCWSVLLSHLNNKSRVESYEDFLVRKCF